jgi:hypothetical protein
MKKTIAALIIASLGLFASQAFAASDCEAKAVDKNGKALAGAAKTSFMKKCEADAAGGSAAASCEAKAVDKNGKPLSGAAKTSSIKKCTEDAAKAKK